MLRRSIGGRQPRGVRGAKSFIDAVRSGLHGLERKLDLCPATEDSLRLVGIAYDRILGDEVGDGNRHSMGASPFGCLI